MQKLSGAHFHPSILIGWLSFGIVCGVVAAQLRLGCDGALLVSLICGFGGFWLRNYAGTVLVIVAGLLIGIWRGGIELDSLKKIAPFYNTTINLTGVIVDDPEYGKKGDQRFRLGDVRIGGQKMPGKIWASSYTILDLKRSDQVVMKGKLREGFGSFAASMSFATVVSAKRPPLNDVPREARDWFAAGIRNAIPEPQASLGVGYLVGQRSALPESLDEQLRIAGLTHIVVASGYNLTVLVRFGRRLFSKYSKYLAFLTASGMISGFVLITGFSPSMSRAALVAGLSLVAWYYGRRVHPLLLLVFAAAVTVLVNPFFIWGDIGWYLSFAAFGGVLLLSPLLTHLLYRGKEAGFFPQLLIETTSAQIVTLPIILYMFGTLSVVSLPANLLVLPLVPLAMLLTFLAGITGVIAPAVAGWVGVPANAVLGYMTAVVDWIASLPGAQTTVPFDTVALVASYIGIIAALLFLWHRTKHDFRGDSIIE